MIAAGWTLAVVGWMVVGVLAAMLLGSGIGLADQRGPKPQPPADDSEPCSCGCELTDWSAHVLDDQPAEILGDVDGRFRAITGHTGALRRAS